MPIGCPHCLVSPEHAHDAALSNAQSCIVVRKLPGGGQGMSLCCLSHGNRELKGQQLSDVRSVMLRLFGAVGLGESVKEPRETPYRRLMLRLEGVAKARGLRRCDGHVFEPVPGCPCAFRVVQVRGTEAKPMTYDDYIRQVLHGDEEYRSDPRLLKVLGTYMSEYDEDDFPRLVHDEGLLSFSNGVYVLSDDRFVEYADEEATLPFRMRGRAARHHIPLPFTGSTDTPLFDKLLAPQFEQGDGQAETLCALIGRLLFRLKRHDFWQVGGKPPRTPFLACGAGFSSAVAPGAGCRVPGAGCRVPGAGCRGGSTCL